MAEPTVAAGFVRGLLELAVAGGADRGALAERSGIDLADLDDQDARVPFARYVALMRAGQVLARDPALALHFGETVDMRELSIVGLIGQSCTTVMEAFAQVNRYARLTLDVDLGTGDRLELATMSDGLWIVDRRPDPNAFPELTESSFARMAASGRRLGVGSPLKEVHVTHPAPAYRSEYDRIFECPISFDAPWNAVRVDPSIMALPLALQPRYVFGLLNERADVLLKELEDARTTRGRVESLLIPILHGGDSGIDRIAAEMGVSRQTLYRRLKAENVTFEKLLDELRHRLALDYLAGNRVSINETAYLVGFSERAAFARAFKRWTGRSPGSARR